MAGQNMDPSFVNAYDRVVEGGDPASIQLALAGLMATYYETTATKVGCIPAVVVG